MQDTDTERADAALATAAGFLRREIDDETRLGDLRLVERDGNVWDVYRAGEVEVYADTLRLPAWGSAQMLAAYLLELDDEGTLPKNATHRGEVLE